MSSSPEHQHDDPATAAAADPAPHQATADAGPANTPAPDSDDHGLLPPGHWTDLAQRQEDEDDGDSAFGDAASSTDSITSSILEYRTIHGRTYHSDSVPGDAQYW